MDVFRFIPGYRDVIFDEGKEPLFLLLLAFLVAFAGARGYARLARERGWGSASVHGVHLHHVVVGIGFVLAAGLVAFMRVGTDEPVRELCAILFGVGAAFVLDEWALVFHLRDVYWSSEGRASVDAAILGLMIAGLGLVVAEPFGLRGPIAAHVGRLVFFVVVSTNAVSALVTFLKAKPYAGFAAVALPPVGWVGAARLAKPGSPWARWFYGAEKLARSRSRLQEGLGTRFRRRLVDVVGGRPTPHRQRRVP